MCISGLQIAALLFLLIKQPGEEECMHRWGGAYELHVRDQFRTTHG